MLQWRRLRLASRSRKLSLPRALPVRAATPPTVEHRMEGVIEDVMPPSPTRAATPPVQQEMEIGRAHV